MSIPRLLPLLTDPPDTPDHHAGDPGPIAAVRCAADGAGTVVRVTGEIDMSSAHLLVEAVQRSCDGHGGPIRLDLSGVTFFSASGITALLRARAAVEAAGGSLHLDEPAPCVRRLLALSGDRPADRFPDPRVGQPAVEPEPGRRTR